MAEITKPNEDTSKPADKGMDKDGALNALRADSSPARPEATPATPGPHILNQEATTAAVNTLSKATGSEQILSVLGSKSSGEIQDILEAYKKSQGRDYVKDLLKKDLPYEDYSAVLTVLRRKDGVTDTAGVIDRNLAAVWDAQEGARRAVSSVSDFGEVEVVGASASPPRPGAEMPKQIAAERNIRDAISTLSTAELQNLDAQLRQAPKSKRLGEVLLSDPSLSAATKTAIELQLYGEHRDGMPTQGRELRGSDYRASHPDVALAMADNALQNKNLPMFQEAMRNAPQSARDQFAVGSAGRQTGDQRLQAAFAGDDLTRAREFAQNGGISMQSLITANDSQFLLWKQQGGIDVALRTARSEDVAAFKRGQELSANPDQLSSLPAEDQRSVAYYRSVHERLQSANPDPRQVAMWEDTLVNGGSFISTFAAGQNANDRFHGVEHMPEVERQRLAKDPLLKSQLDRTVDAIATGDERTRLHELIERKLASGSEAEAAKVGRTVEQTLADNAPAGDVLNAIARMGGAEAHRYREDPQFKQNLDTGIHKYLSQSDVLQSSREFYTHDPELQLADRMLAAITRDAQPLADPLTRIAMKAAQAIDGNNTPHGARTLNLSHPEEARGIAQDIDTVLRENPELAKRLRDHPYSEEAQALSWAMRVAGSAAKPRLEMNDGRMFARILSEGHLNLDDKMRLSQSSEERYRIIMAANPQESAMLLEKNPQQDDAKRLQESVFSQMSSDAREVMENGLRNHGELDAADKMRLAIIDGSVTPTNLSSILNGQDVVSVREQYSQRYHQRDDKPREMDSEALAQVKGAADYLRVGKLLSSSAPTPGDEVNARNELAGQRPGGLFIGSHGDIANIEAGRNDLNRLIEQYSAGQRLLNGPELQQSLSAMDQAIGQYDKDANRTREMADRAIELTIQAAVLASAAFTEGVTLPIALTFAGGIFHAGLSGETDPWNVTKELIKGTVNAGMMLIPGTQLGVLKGIGELAAESTAARLASVLRQGTQNDLQLGLKKLAGEAISSGNQTIPPDKFLELMRPLVQPNTSEAKLELLSKALQAQFQADMNAGAAKKFTEAVRTYEAAKSGAVYGLTSGTVSGGLNWNGNLSIGENFNRLSSTVAESTLEGTGMVLGFGAAANGLRAALRRTNIGELMVRAEDTPGSDLKSAQQLAITHTNKDGSKTVSVVVNGSEMAVDPKDTLQLVAVNNNGDGSRKAATLLSESEKVASKRLRLSEAVLRRYDPDYQYQAEISKFNELSEKRFTNPKQSERVDKLLSEFEKRANEEGFDANKKALFMKQINRLLEDDPNAAIPQAERTALAEQIINHAAHPTSVDQGANKTCNMTTLEVRNYVRNPEKNAQMIADIAATGKYVTADGRTIDLSKLEGGIHPDAEARKNMHLQNRLGDEIKVDGSRDFASQIAQMALVNTKWQAESFNVLDGHVLKTWNTAFDKDGHLIGGIKNRDKVQDLYDIDHNRLYFYTPGDKAYTESGKPIDVDPDKLAYGPRSLVIGLVEESNLTKVFDVSGARITQVQPGTRGYDANGRESFRATAPGEIAYDKKINGSSERERVVIRDGDEWKPLKDESGIIDAPTVYNSEFEGINRRATNVRESGYVLSSEDFETVGALEHKLNTMKINGEFPAVLDVWTGSRPFSSSYGLETAWGGGGYHVVNIHDYDPATKRIKISNQWGSRFDYMENGVSLQTAFDGMSPSSLQEYLHDHKVARWLWMGGLGTGLLYGEAKAIDYFRNQDDGSPPARSRTQ
jgi:hypothetical protein